MRKVPCVLENDFPDEKSTIFIEQHVNRCIQDIDALKSQRQEKKTKPKRISNKI